MQILTTLVEGIFKKFVATSSLKSLMIVKNFQGDISSYPIIPMNFIKM